MRKAKTQVLNPRPENLGFWGLGFRGLGCWSFGFGDLGLRARALGV